MNSTHPRPQLADPIRNVILIAEAIREASNAAANADTIDEACRVGVEPLRRLERIAHYLKTRELRPGTTRYLLPSYHADQFRHLAERAELAANRVEAYWIDAPAPRG